MPTSYIDSNIDHYEQIYTPRDIRTQLPAGEEIIRHIITSRTEIQRILTGDSGKVMLIVGPCSIHKPDEALEYAGKLRELAGRVEDKFLVILRAYFEKSRTGLGWKGLIDEPDLDGKSNVAKGLRIARQLLLQINAIGMPCATEIVDPITPQYILDLVSWSAIGARSVESRRSRELASGISTPVGFKNRTDGNLDVAIEALNYAREAHSFTGITEEGRIAEIKTRGNKFGHIILRGGTSGINYDAQSVLRAHEKLRKRNLPDLVMIDCSHANSNKDYKKQPPIFLDVIGQIRSGNRKIVGIMLESYLEEGNQPYGKADLKKGVSITDPCISFAETERIILDAHERLQ
jgi:3-deoxy-7-phosphoheptulonate synthase